MGTFLKEDLQGSYVHQQKPQRPSENSYVKGQFLFLVRRELNYMDSFFCWICVLLWIPFLRRTGPFPLCKLQSCGLFEADVIPGLYARKLPWERRPPAGINCCSWRFPHLLNQASHWFGRGGACFVVGLLCHGAMLFCFQGRLLAEKNKCGQGGPRHGFDFPLLSVLWKNTCKNISMSCRWLG